MPYWTIGALALIIQLVINQGVLWGHAGHEDEPSRRAYRYFLLSVTLYYAIDALWGLLYGFHPVPVLVFVTAMYFAAMAFCILLWTKYVIAYLNEGDAFERILLCVGYLLSFLQIAALAVNAFLPVLFWFDANGVYHAEPMRYASLAMQVLMFFLTSVYTLRTTFKTKGSARRRNRAIGLFGLAMTLLVGAQMVDPLLPLYSVGYMLGSCVLHAFVLEDEKEERRGELEEALERERRQRRELEATRRIAYTDPLTGVKSKYAYMEIEELMTQRVSEGLSGDFAVAVFDLNCLKTINDTMGHAAGDRYIIAACELICSYFERSSVFRIGGDEFVALVEGSDYRKREQLMAAFNARIQENQHEGSHVVVASGMADFDPASGDNYRSVFAQADTAMYERKHALKAMSA